MLSRSSWQHSVWDEADSHTSQCCGQALAHMVVLLLEVVIPR
jgi:hypothetical protein